MVTRLNRKFSIGDYITYKGDNHTIIYEIVIINYIKPSITVRIVHPTNLKTGTKTQPYFSLNSVKPEEFIVLNRESVKVLYGD